jgi:hypothetical protein
MRKSIEGVSGDELLNFIRWVVAGDSNEVKTALRAAPGLAKQSVAVGATRSTARQYFLTEIRHYICKGDTALHFAAAAYQLPIARLLIAKGADLRARNRLGAEPLHYACDGGPGSSHWNPKAQAAMVTYLVTAGAKPDALNKLGVAPLHRAVRGRCSAAVAALLKGGANINLANKSGTTALKLAQMTTGRGGSGSDAAKNEQAVILELLQARGASTTPSRRQRAGR